MCTGAEPAVIAAWVGAGTAAAGTAVSVYGAMQQADQAKDAAKQQEQQGIEDAAYAASEAQLQARAIRKAGDKQRAEARAALAGSGVVVGEGTAEQIDSQIGANVEEDALMAIYDGNNQARSIKQGGALAANRSRNAASAATIGAYGSALQGGSTLARGWNTSAKRS